MIPVPEWQEIIINKFGRDFFVEVDNPSHPMYYGFSCNKGWRFIIENTLEMLSMYEGVTIFQIKEKYGSLRIYTNYDYKYTKIESMLDYLSRKYTQPLLKYIQQMKWWPKRLSLYKLYWYTPRKMKEVRIIEQIAYDRSLKVCEMCGDPGILREDKRRHQTLCDQCNI